VAANAPALPVNPCYAIAKLEFRRKRSQENCLITVLRQLQDIFGRR